jgi:hypothetical protein
MKTETKESGTRSTAEVFAHFAEALKALEAKSEKLARFKLSSHPRGRRAEVTCAASAEVNRRLRDGTNGNAGLWAWA